MKKQTRDIAIAHIHARLSGTFDDPEVNTKEELISALKDGKTFSRLMDEIEIRFTSITAIMLSRKLFHTSQNYKKGVYKGFKLLLEHETN